MGKSISVIIPTCNRVELLALCLEKLAPGKQTLDPAFYEVIVTDDGSDQVGEYIRKKYPWVRWEGGPRKGPAANRNNGAKHAEGEWLVFLDDDCIPDKELLDKYAHEMKMQRDKKVFEGKIVVDRPKYRLDIMSPVNLSGGYLWACNFSIERTFFMSLRGFDERFPFAAMEDVDLKFRIEAAGAEIAFVPDAFVCHPWRKKGGWKKIMEHNHSTFLFLEKHPQQRSKITPRYYLHLVARTFIYETIPGIIKFKGKGAWTAFSEHIGFLKMAILLMLKKNRKK